MTQRCLTQEETPGRATAEQPPDFPAREAAGGAIGTRRRGRR